MSELIEQLNERAHDPKRATDERPPTKKGSKPAAFVATPTATEQQIVDAEKNLGFPLPELLRRVYLEVGNGGFGPGYGLLSLDTMTQAATSKGLLPICEWGADITSALDCLRAQAPVIRIDPNMPKADVDERVPLHMRFDRASVVKEACWVECPSLEEWLTGWVEDKQLFYAAYGDGSDVDDEEDEDDEEGESEPME